MPSEVYKQKLRTRAVASVSPSIKTRGIHTYSTVSKAGVSIVSNIPQKNTCQTSITPAAGLKSNTKKRKLEPEDDSSPRCINHNGKTKRRFNSNRDPQTPCRPIPSKERESSTEVARGLLDKFLISGTPTNSYPRLDYSIQSPLQQTLKKSFSPISELPSDLLDLVGLNSAFLTTFSIHCAHNGTHCPADLRIICQEVAQTWGKRHVTLTDLRKVIGVMNANIDFDFEKKNKLSRLTLSDYGHAKICIELSEFSGNTAKVARPVNVELLSDIFVLGLQSEWRKCEGTNTQDFIDNLPLEPITRCASVMKISPLRAKGRRRLENIRNGVKCKTETSNQLGVSSNAKNMTLLERLRAKQLHQTKIIIPSNSEIARRASLGRVEEVSTVLTMISTSSSIGQQRVSFTLPTILGKLKDSLKICRAEGDSCIRLIATEIAPEWIRIVNLKEREALVVNRDARPGDLDMRERVKQIEMNLEPTQI